MDSWNGIDAPIGGKWCNECGEALGDEHTARIGRAIVHVDCYGPDGVPFDGPRTTAAEYADSLAYLERDCRHDPYMARVIAADWTYYRNAAEYEGERYCEAIRGARAMRDKLYHNWYYLLCATPLEMAQGIPAHDALYLAR